MLICPRCGYTSGMGMRIWGVGLVAVMAAMSVTASTAPVVQASTSEAGLTAPEFLSELPASLADAKVANTPHTEKPDKIGARWACKMPMRIFYAGAPDIDEQRILRELAYPVRYLQDLGYDVQVARQVAYQYDYSVPTKPGDVLLVVTTTDAPKTALGPTSDWATTEFTSEAWKAIRSAKITVDGKQGLPSDVILHELGHVLGLPHKDGTTMTASGGSTGAFDAAETAAVDCR